MKKITILLSSALILFLITGNNASYAPHYKDYSGPHFQGKKPNMNSGGRFMPKRNRLGDDISGYGYKNILKKGNVFKGNVRVLPNRGSYTDSGRVTYIRSGKDGFLNEATLYQNGKDGFIVQTGEDGLHNNGAFRERINNVSISGSGQSDVVTTLEHGPGIANQPKGVPLKFINGEWVEDFVWTEDLPYD